MLRMMMTKAITCTTVKNDISKAPSRIKHIYIHAMIITNSENDDIRISTIQRNDFQQNV